MQRFTHGENLWYDEVSWTSPGGGGRQHYTVGTVCLDIFERTDGLNVIRRLAGAQPSPLAHYLSVEAPETLAKLEMTLGPMSSVHPPVCIDLRLLTQHALPPPLRIAIDHTWQSSNITLTHLNSLLFQAKLEERLPRNMLRQASLAYVSISMEGTYCEALTSCEANFQEDIVEALRATYVDSDLQEHWSPVLFPFADLESDEEYPLTLGGYDDDDEELEGEEWRRTFEFRLTRNLNPTVHRGFHRRQC